MYENIKWRGDEKLCYSEIKKLYFDCLIGYRHVRLRSSNNQPLELSTLFIYSKHEEELISCDMPEVNGFHNSSSSKSFKSKVREASDASKEVCSYILYFSFYQLALNLQFLMNEIVFMLP